MDVNKIEFIKDLEKLIKKTRAGSDIESLTYVSHWDGVGTKHQNNSEYVCIDYKHHSREICITGNSNLAILKRVVEEIDY